MTAFEDFVNLELPRRAALLTVTITGFDDDPNVSPPDILANSPAGTYYLQETPETLWRKTTTAGLWVENEGGGGSPNAVTASAVITDLSIVRGDGGARGVKGSSITISNTDDLVIPATGSISIPGTGTNSERLGAGSTAAGNNSVSIGFGAAADYDGMVVVGKGAGSNIISGDNDGAIVIGGGAFAGNGGAGVDAAIVIGQLAVARSSAFDSIVIGSGAVASSFANDSIVIGRGAFAERFGTVVIGAGATTLNSEQVCIGFEAQTNSNSVAIGFNANANSVRSVAIGRDTVAAGSGVAVGEGVSVAVDSTAVGKRSGATGLRAAVFGKDAKGNADDTLALGVFAICNHANSVVIGRGAVSTAISRCTIGTIGGSFDLELQFGKGLGVFGVVPPTTQPVKIPDPSDLPTALTAIESLINVIEDAGLAASV